MVDLMRWTMMRSTTTRQSRRWIWQYSQFDYNSCWVECDNLEAPAWWQERDHVVSKAIKIAVL
jgi:hypothetical protein